MSSHGSRPRRSTPGSRTDSQSDRAFGSNSFREYRSNYSHDNSESYSSDRENDWDTLELPLKDEAFIKKMYENVKIPARIADNPKNSLTQIASKIPGTTLVFKYKVGTLDKRRLWRTTITLELDPPTVGEGDSPAKKGSKNLAALSVVYQLVQQGLLDDQGKISKSLLPQHIPREVERTLSDNKTKIDYDRARQFIDHYVQKLDLCREDIEYNPLLSGTNERDGGVWEAVMTLGGSRLGFGRGPTKKLAQKACYVEVAVYLEARDPTLWRSFMEAAKTRRNLAIIPPVHCAMGEALEDEIYELCVDMKKSTLYKNALRLRPSPPHPNASQTIPGVQPPFRRSPELPSFEEKDRILKERRDKYLIDPTMKPIRDDRVALPVTTYARELLDHIRNNDVTICIAATGSGKTTQIPQLILDDYIDQGEGSRCNVICTQPRRLAAVSAARRVARERGERLGASIGYQVWPWVELPEERGSVTFCTAGIFLEWMRSPLYASDSSAQEHCLDDATHIVVDEVHERDVNTDLSLVVLKRLLAERKAKGNPIRVILMSAPIDPTPFQRYFPDDKGQPSKVIKVPSHGSPVRKHFLDEFASELASIPGSAEVFAQDSVANYVHNELGSAALQLCSPFRPTPVLSTNRSGRVRLAPTKDGHFDTGGEELELPTPLVALTIAHVLRNSNSGHVLTFLPGWDEIQSVHQYLTNPASNLAMDLGNPTNWSIHLLHSTTSVTEQEDIFKPPPKGVRRIILATNVAETSVTIPGVVYVIDTAKTNELRSDPERHTSSPISAWIDSFSLNQRAGCAGRHGSGEYFGIISQKRASGLQPRRTVEMKRVDLSKIAMHVKALNLPGMSAEGVLSEVIEPPAAERVVSVMKDLTIAGALDAQKNLTPLGEILLQLPVEVQVGWVMILGTFFKCLDNALTLAAILTNRNPFVTSIHPEQAGSDVKGSWSSHSDVLAALRAYNAWWEIWRRGDHVSANLFCSGNLLSESTLLTIQRTKGYLLRSLYHADVITASMGRQGAWTGKGREVTVPQELDINRESTPLLVALISAASRPKFAVRAGYNMHRTSQDDEVFIHPSSVNHRKKGALPPDNTPSREKQIIAFAEKRQDTSITAKHPREFIVTTTRLDPVSYLLFGAHNIQVAGRGLECDEWLPIIGNRTALDQISRLKETMDLCFLRVCEGITISNRHRHEWTITSQREKMEEAAGDDETGRARERDLPLSSTEIEEFGGFTENLVYVLNQYNDEGSRIAPQSATDSGLATPVDSSHSGQSRRQGSSNGGLRRTRSPCSSNSRTSSISEGHQSPEDDGESRKEVDWYDTTPSQPSAANFTSQLLGANAPGKPSSATNENTAPPFAGYPLPSPIFSPHEVPRSTSSAMTDTTISPRWVSRARTTTDATVSTGKVPQLYPTTDATVFTRKVPQLNPTSDTAVSTRNVPQLNSTTDTTTAPQPPEKARWKSKVKRLLSRVPSRQPR